jgi:hypothetical protein
MATNSASGLRRAAASLVIGLITACAAGAQGIPSKWAGFVENRGQWSAGATHRATFGAVSVWLGGSGWTLAVEERSWAGPGPSKSSVGEPPGDVRVRGVNLRMRVDGSADVAPSGHERLPSRHNWFLGNDPAKWVTDAQAWRSVRLPGVLPGVTVVAREQEGRFEYDLVLEPGVDPSAVVISCKGQDSLAVERGELVMRTALGDFRHTAPVAWEEGADGGRIPVACAWRVLGEDRVRFEVTGRDPKRRLVIDPGVLWSTVAGGTQNEFPGSNGMAVNASGGVDLAGITTSSDFPTTTGAYSGTLSGANTWDTWVARYDNQGNVQWATYLGGTGWEWAYGIAAAPGNTIAICGVTSSANFPTVNAFDSTYNLAGPNAWGDAFLAILNPALTSGAQLTWSTFFGGSNDDRLNSISVDGGGIVTAAGWTYSNNVPGIAPPNPYQTFQGGQDGMVCRLNPALSGSSQLLWMTWIGGSGQDFFGPHVLLPGGRVVVEGGTASGNYPLVNSPQGFIGGALDLALSVLDPSLPGTSQLVYSTFLGGSDNELDFGLDVEWNGRITVGGSTLSSDYPVTVGAFDTSHNSPSFHDAFVTRIDPTLPPANQLVFSTFVGGNWEDLLNDLFVDAGGQIHAVGSVASWDFPITPGAYQQTFQGSQAPYFGVPYDAFAFTLDPTGKTMIYSTFLGGMAGYEFAYEVARTTCGQAVISGLTRSLDFPSTTGIYFSADDLFLLTLEMLPTGATRFGSATLGCNGPPEIGVLASPTNGNTAFGITCAGAPPLGNGLLGIAPAWLNPPLVVSGLSVWVDPASTGFLMLPVTSNAAGYCVKQMAVPAGPGFIGLTGYAQFAWADSCAPGGLSGSCGLSVTIQ